MNADDDYADLYGDDEGQPQAVSAGAPPEVPDQAGKSGASRRREVGVACADAWEGTLQPSRQPWTPR